MALTPEDKTWISGQIEAVAEKVWAQKVGNPDYPNKTAKQVLNDLGVARDAVADPKIGAKNIAAGTPLALVIEAVTKPEA